MGDFEELEIVGAQFPARTSPSLILRKRRGGTAYALTLSEHQLDTIRAAGRACACKAEPAVMTLAAALGRPVVAVAIAMTAGEPPRTWMLLGVPGEGDEPAAGAPVAVPVDPVDALATVARAGCALVLTEDGERQEVGQRWRAHAAGTPDPDAAPATPGDGGPTAVPEVFRAVFEPRRDATAD
jgi:hypothetical protein